VVEGLSAALEVFIDGTNVDDSINEVAATQDYFTWMDETIDNEAADEPKLGLEVNGGYDLSIGEDMSLGIGAGIGLYDLLGGNEFGFTVSPSFSGFGAAVDVGFDFGLGMINLTADASYAIMDAITPSITFQMVNLGDSGNSLAYDKDNKYSSGAGKVKDIGGMIIGGGVDVNLGALVDAITASVGGSFKYNMPTEADGIIDWDANVSFTLPGPVDFITLTGAFGDVGLFEGAARGGTIDWDAGIDITYGIATIAMGIGSDYDKSTQYTGYSVVTSISF
jgi:hypothetical protein